MAQDLLEKAFLSELEALEKFRISYTGLYKNTPLAREDPDIRRLIEAMAMFTARTRIAAQRSLDMSLIRVFRQHFPYLLDPVPAMTMLRADTTARYVDVTELPRGTDVYLIERIEDEKKKIEQRLFRMRTLSKLRILPIEIERVDIFKTRGRSYRLFIELSAAHSRKDEVGEINLHVNHLDDLASSLMVMHAFKSHCRAVSVVFDAKRIDEETVGQPCNLGFGMPKGAREELARLEHPLQLARSFVHYPRQELYLNVEGIRTPKSWQRFTLLFDMKDTWPAELRLSPDAFNLHVVPMVNVRKDMADPIECDGKSERYPLHHSDVGARFVMQRLLAVYKMSDKDGLVPLEPGVVGTQRESYEVVYEGRDEERRASLALHLPSAFEKPERVAIEALWYQPSIQGRAEGEFHVKLADRYVDGIQWSCGGPLSAPRETELVEDRDGLLQLLSIKNQRFLGTEDLIFLLGALGVSREPFFASIVRALRDVRVATKPLAKQSHGFKYIYELTFEDLDATDLPRLDLFCGKLLDVLAAWSVEEVVEIAAKVKNLERTLQYPPPLAA